MDERELTDASARSPHEFIISSMTGVMLMLSPMPKRTSAITIWPRPSFGPIASKGLGPIRRKPISCSRRPVKMIGLGPNRSLLISSGEGYAF
eukprot:scaffold305659_cov39-Tisochrysis_lutea.AAC.3